MKRIKYVALLITLTLGLIGGTYAYWDDMVVAQGTVGTGTMNVIITMADASDIVADNVPYVTASPSDISADGKSADFSVSNIYPSDLIRPQKFVVRAKNTGSIPVKLGDLKFTKQGGSANSAAVWSSLKGRVDLQLIYPDGSWGLTVHSSEEFYFQDGIEGAIKGLMANYGALEPGQTAQFVIWFWLDRATCGNDAQQQNIAFRLIYNWNQWNML